LIDFVLDNSICMRWCLKDATTPYPDDVLKQLVAGDRAHVPVLWLYEVVSVVAKNQRAGEITAIEASDFISDLNSLSITIDPDSYRHVLGDTYRLALTHGLTGYDASYLELAIRKNIPLATLDQELINACKAIGHPLL
jgi:predicted nucleic acid-binding protein